MIISPLPASVSENLAEKIAEKITEQPLSLPLPSDSPRRSTSLLILTGLWIIIFFAALFAPPLLDDADGTHANAARHMALTGDLVTLHVNGIRYLEKAPLPYWLDALSFRIFGFNTFAAHLPQAIGVLLLALLGFHWASKAFGPRTAFYTGLAILTSAGVFLFTRIYIPEVLLSLFLCTALYTLLQSLNSSKIEGVLTEPEPRAHNLYPYLMWTALALAVLTKGLVALVFFFGTAIIYLALTGEYRNLRKLKPLTGLLLFLAIAAPWHILAGLRNTGGMNGHGFFWFYFVNEHFLRFLGKRYPMDYNKLPGYLFWSLHLVWLFPWSLFLPIAFIKGWNQWKQRRNAFRHAIKMGRIPEPRPTPPYGTGYALRYHRNMFTGALGYALNGFGANTTLLLFLFSALVLVFFSLSTNQEYYTFPAYLPILALIAAALTRAENTYDEDKSSRRWITFAHATLTVIGVTAASALAYGLWTSRNLPFVPDIGDLLAHRGVGDYTLSMSHFFDLTGPSFAALRLPAALAAFAFAIGPAVAWWLRTKSRHLAATTAIALTSTVFLIAAHIALVRFEPMLSSQDLAEKIQELEDDRAISRDNQVLLYGDQSYGSSIPFYLGEDVYLVDGRSSSMLFGSTFPDAPHIFLTHDDLLKTWGTGERKILFVPLEKRDEVDRLLGSKKILLEETSGKALFTDRPLDNPAPN
ncbi:dolichyl-phosphate-mannose-protein mannosyltransferase [Edaphobacter aggregans]|uniref:Dolichyl-phosphate-mannose-protein mannosyltransferase n=1 Tax=Edaphobacter aggregans TaxID=570835 RepID=A0A3R9NT23_9BACT|nr:glycosyltransferase family 39 protein [Edaphobacter aggregans]RSL16103.1 dolichyl-phosphate-mannose-protein mannosyltransferase [Edaphobacter aggregans]